MANTQAARKSTNERGRERQALAEGDVAEIGRNLMEHFKDYARENPETTALWCFGIGFILGWKLKPW